ncbi:unnamed protein product, partial [Darwinula stevensoni]
MKRQDPKDRCRKCEEHSSLGRLQCYERIGRLDIRDNLQIYMGAGEFTPLKEAAGVYVAENYREAYTKAYSLPEGYILSKNKCKKLRDEARNVEDVGMPFDELSVAKVFDRLKHAFRHVPSLTVANYTFTKTFLKGINQEQREKFVQSFGIAREGLEPGDHDVFGTGISGNDVIGVFFQVKGTTNKANPRTIIKNLAKATRQRFSETFSALRCRDCRERILTADDLDKPYSFARFLARHGITLEKTWDRDPYSPVMKTFKDIFDLYVCAASAVDLPRSPTELLIRSEEQMKQMIVILTPKQRELVKSVSKVIFISGGSGTGKTFVLRKRAFELAKRNEVLVINVAGGSLTQEFQSGFEGNMNIKVIDGREEHLAEELNVLTSFLRKEGKGKHVVIDEVPITLGFHGILTPEALSTHWKSILDIMNDVNTITLAFRPNDQTYSRDFILQDVRPGNFHIHILQRVKRNSRKISELFLAIGDYSRRVFISRERTLPMNQGDHKESGRGSLPGIYLLPSCFSLHPATCQDEMICRAVRVSHAIIFLHSKLSNSLPVIVIVDHKRMKMALVNILTSIDDSLFVIFLSESREFSQKVSTASIPLVIVTEDEIIGCHLRNVVVVVDFPQTQWRNYNRTIAASCDNVTLIIEEEEWRMGKYSRLSEEIPGWKIKMTGIDEGLRGEIEIAWKNYKGNAIGFIREAAFSPAVLPAMEMDNEIGNEEEDERDVEKMLSSLLTGLFGYPGSGKSRRVNMLIKRVLALHGRVFLVHCGGFLSQKLLQQRWDAETNVNILLQSDYIDSLPRIIDAVKKRQAMNEAIKGPTVAVVEDYTLSRYTEGELNKAMQQLKYLGIKLILVSKPHSRDAMGTTIENVIKLLKDTPNCTVISLLSDVFSLRLLNYVKQNEVPLELNLKAKSLLTTSTPGSVVPGPQVKCYRQCSGRHAGYICEGEHVCGPQIKRSVPMFSSILSSLRENNSRVGIVVLLTDEHLLKKFTTAFSNQDHDIHFSHPKDFRGCESSVVISINIGDEWILEAISRSRTQLFIIDDIQEHRDLWRTMAEEGRVEALNLPFICVSDILSLDDLGKFLKRPTWDDVGERIGNEAVGRGDLLHESTGVILSLSPETWEYLNSEENFPLSSTSSPFADWGYVWDGNWEGEPSWVRGMEKFFRERGVEWNNESQPQPYPPVTLKMDERISESGGVLESLSMYLTGSLMHFSLIQ